MAELSNNLLFAYTCTVVSATVPIWIGSYASRGETAAETMSSKDAYMFPVIGSCVLFGLYLAFQLFSKEYVNMLLTAYFLLFSISALTSTLTSFMQFLFKPILGENSFILKNHNIKFTIFKKNIDFDLSLLMVLNIIISTVTGVWYAFTKHWIANNIFGFSFSVQGISMISPGSYTIGSIMLIGLFFYDIFWVFGTDVMVTVAKSFDGPIKLLFPKNFFTAMETGVPFEFSMLGLGDIVIPGIFIALLIRFDDHQKNPLKPNFYVCLFSYVAGLVSTIAVMHLFNHPQPALLYLVPFTIIFSFFTALVRGELSALLNYTENKEEEKKDEKKSDDKKSDNKTESSPTAKKTK